ncbi:unnamed protein product [Hydatigera taeniaeformis]|uniref:Uncharacterized protein n=1 Tax=Hydatigena taeniaeformis TaxID=6205 RepID=A0A0R3WJ54_HYDTA|nr:unnamed protein product [Hydatigera taeniaeformis]
MPNSDSLNTEFLDSLNPDDYIFGLIHFPPGFDVKNLLTAETESMLLKFFRKLNKHPLTPLRKRFPTSPSSHALELCFEGSSSHTRLPFLGRSSDGGYCLRQLDVQRLQICLSDDVYGQIKYVSEVLS